VNPQSSHSNHSSYNVSQICKIIVKKIKVEAYILEKPIQLWEPKKQQCKEKAFGDDKHSFEEA
jgi:hypothetical protein